MSGAWVLRGTRVPAATVFENIASGARLDDIVEWYVDRERVKAVIDFVVRSLDPPSAWPDVEQRTRDIFGDRTLAPGGSDVVAEERDECPERVATQSVTRARSSLPAGLEIRVLAVQANVRSNRMAGATRMPSCVT